ncbi:MAG: ribosome maturation factor RimP [Actinomycetia bacterium]|nr:ribosome maturation factor RimP [Actinomycetes bacterium]
MSKTDTMPRLTTAQRLRGLIGPYLEAEHLELDDLQLMGGGGARVLRVVVDGQGGVTLERLAETSRRLSRLLDADADLQGPYRLEVTSPGLERRLCTARHFEKSVDREVVLKVRTGDRVHTFRGRLASADQQGCEVSVDGDPQWFAYSEVLSARTVFRWQAAPKPGKGKAT